jgi:hypothetical protein
MWMVVTFVAVILMGCARSGWVASRIPNNCGISGNGILACGLVGDTTRNGWDTFGKHTPNHDITIATIARYDRKKN